MGEHTFRMSCQCDDHDDVLVQWDEATRRCPLCAIRSAERRARELAERRGLELRTLSNQVTRLEDRVARIKSPWN